MVKGTYQLPPRIRMELLHSNIWWLDKVELLCKIFTHAKGRNYITSLCPFLPNTSPPCLKLYNVSMSIPAQCDTIGKHSRCLREWKTQPVN